MARVRGRGPGTLALPLAVLALLAGCTGTRPLAAGGTPPHGPATYQVTVPELIAPPVRMALDEGLARRGMRQEPGESPDYFVSLSFSDRPLGIGTFAGDARPGRSDPSWVDGPQRSGKREWRLTVRFVDRQGAEKSAIAATAIVRHRAPQADIRKMVEMLFAAPQ